ncbi:efflux RND transporter permease subunit [Marinobacterium jannaschii]|uniref:efflux RND transporter permease subunit n=1 Tax=Marinobacterium jannaschii TaxID=64970 RepID=UPI0004865F17|nr:efflux RND transporter permease subunit [Marinobacterium jannaschii]
MIAWFARNHVAANLLMLSILIAGLISLGYRIPLEVFPDFESDTISVSVSLRGATPEDSEKSLSIRIEQAVSDLEGIEEITSRSVEGSATVWIEVNEGYDPRELLLDVKARVDEISTFPIEAERPVITLASYKREVISVAVAGDLSELELSGFAAKIRDDLLRLPGVTQVELDGVRDFEISVEVKQDKLRDFGLTLQDIAERIENSSLDLSAGNIRSKGGDILIRSRGQAYHRDQFERITIKSNADGSIVQLRDIAKVTDGFEETALRTRFNGLPAAMIEVYRVGDQSAISVADAIKGYIDRTQPLLPQGIHLSYWDDDSDIVKKRIKTLTSNALQGGALVLMLLTLFLRPSIAIWVFIGIPMSFMGAFLLMPVLGVTLNIISLFGFILVLGIVVDDAIVTGENVYRHMQNAESGLQAAISGTQEVAVPVTFGVLTTVAAFMPIYFMDGGRAALFAQIPAIVIPVLLFSLIESKFILPAHLKHIRLRTEKPRNNVLSRMQQSFADGFERIVLRYYQPLLRFSIRHRYSTLALFSGIFILILTMVISGWTRFIFFPRVQSETARATLTMPAGTPFNVTDRHIVRMVEAAGVLQDRYRDEDGNSAIMNILSTTGARGGGAEQGRVRFELLPSEERDSTLTTSRLVREWRELIGPIPGTESLIFRAEIGRSSDPVDIQLSSGNVDDLEAIAAKVRAQLATYPGVFDISDNLSDGKEELQVELTEQAHTLGLTRNDVIRQVRQHFFGIEVQRVQRGRDDIRVMVRLPRNERQSVASLQQILITTREGQVPLADVAQLVPGKSAASIYRVDEYRTVSVTADLEKENVNATVLQRDIDQFMQALVLQYPGADYRLEGEAREQRDSFQSLAIGLGVVLFTIYSLLAIPFRSYLQPLIVMSVIPFGAIGAILGHWLMGMNLTIMSVLGLLALVGIVVNDSLVLVDFVNRKRAALSLHDPHAATLEAVLQAGVVRFRPVMLTSMTTFIGLMPLLFEKATQAQFLIPMAVSLGFGIIFATLITLLMVPVNFMILEDIKRSLGIGRTPASEQPVQG